MGPIKNVGSADKTIRLIVGLLLAAFGVLSAGLSSTVGIIALVVGLVLLVTAAVGCCPLFRIFGINSIKTK